MISRILLGASATIILFLGGVHLAYTAFTHKFNPTEERRSLRGESALLCRTGLGLRASLRMECGRQRQGE
jgi:hypothetical protein